MAITKQERSRKNDAYRKENTKMITLRFFPGDMELYEYAKQHENMSGYIKDLIRADMEKGRR